MYTSVVELLCTLNLYRQSHSHTFISVKLSKLINQKQNTFSFYVGLFVPEYPLQASGFKRHLFNFFVKEDRINISYNKKSHRV
jgi:hypothetical protein